MANINIENFNGIEVKIDYKPILDKYADECKDNIKQNVTAQKLNRTGKYLAGWTVEEDTDFLGNYSVVVWNETSWQLTHLLENGHAIVNKKGGTGWASAHPHIAKGYRSVKRGFIDAINKVQLDIKI